MNKNENKINKIEEKLLKPNSVKDLATGVLYYNSASILGPLILFLGLGFFLDKTLGTKPYLMMIGLGIAFITTNILIFRKIRKLMKKFDTEYPPEELEPNSEQEEIINKEEK